MYMGWFSCFLHARVAQGLKTLDNEDAGVKETFNAVGQASFFASIKFVVDFADALILEKTRFSNHDKN